MRHAHDGPVVRVRADGTSNEPWEGNGPCADCGGRSICWRAPDDLWEIVAANVPFLCPVCFVARCWARTDLGYTTWRLVPA